MDVAKVARDYFLSSQSSLLIPNREYGSRKLIRVGLGRSNSAGNVLRHNTNSNINKNHHREEDGDDTTNSSFSKRAGVFSNSKAKSRSLSGVPEENGVREYPWRTVSSDNGNASDSPFPDSGIAEEYTTSSALSTAPQSSYPAHTDNKPTSANPVSESSPPSTITAASTRRVNFSTTKSASLSALPPPSPPALSSPSTPSAISPRPRPSSISNNSNNSNSSSATAGGLGNLKGLFGVNMNGSSGFREKALAMKSASLDSADFYPDVDQMDFRTTSSKTWQHPPDALINGHILYTVKFLGECVVERTKGTDVVKEAIRKMKFNKHIRRAEGQKPPKVELLISSEAVCILESKSNSVLHRYPLHLISYCADDKSDKRMITFIAKEQNGTRHFCYVFDSEKCAEEITLTIGQAFDLAYKKFLESNSNEGDLKKQYIVLQKKVNQLSFENQTLKKRIAELEKLKDRSDLDYYRMTNQISDLSAVTLNLRESSTDDDDTAFGSSSHQPTSTKAVVGRRLENLLPLDGASSPSNGTGTRHTNGAHAQTPDAAAMPILSPPPPNTRSHRANSLRSQPASTPSTPGTPNNSNPFYASPSSTAQAPGQVDPFGMQAFSPSWPAGNSEQELIDIRDGFSRGLSFGTEDFTLDDLDPLNQRM